MKRWAALVVVLYGIILLLLTVPLLLFFGFEFDQEHGWQQTFGLGEIRAAYANWGYWFWLAVMVAGQALLLLVPLELARARPVRRRRLWLPILVAGFFLGNLVLAGITDILCVLFKDEGLVLIGWPASISHNLVEGLPSVKSAITSLGLQPNEDLFIMLTTIGLVGIFWAIWGLIFYRYARADDPGTLLTRVTRWLLRGSALELLVAVPSHVMVRQRDDCCAPFATFWGITTGLSVMLLSFGPGVFFLFAKRMRSLKPRPGGRDEG